MAGSETSATMLSGCVYYLCKSASVMQKLTSEIREAFVTEEEIKFGNAATLPYLAAVIEESLRMYPPVVTSLKRVSPVGGTTVDSYFIPENVWLIYLTWEYKLTFRARPSWPVTTTHPITQVQILSGQINSFLSVG